MCIRDRLGLQQLAHVEYILIELFGTVGILHVDGDLLVGEEHEVLDKDLCSQMCIRDSFNRIKQVPCFNCEKQ